LAEAERQFIRAHADEIEQLAKAKALPETTVTWRPPSLDERMGTKASTEVVGGDSSASIERSTNGPDAEEDAPPTASVTTAPPPESLSCPYCGDQPCVGPKSRWFPVFHWYDPAEVKRRAERATGNVPEHRPW
jgi:hypothetical protein